MIPVMMEGMAVGNNKSHGLGDEQVALAVTGGVAALFMTRRIPGHGDALNTSYGLLLLLGFCLVDGCTCTFQQVQQQSTRSVFSALCNCIVAIVLGIWLRSHRDGSVANGHKGECTAFVDNVLQ